MAKDVISRKCYKAGDVFKLGNGASYVGAIGNSGTVGGCWIYLPDEISSDVSTITFSGTPNFWGDTNGRVTGITVTNVIKTGANVLTINFSLPSGTSRTSNTVGFLNFASGQLSFS